MAPHVREEARAGEWPDPPTTDDYREALELLAWRFNVLRDPLESPRKFAERLIEKVRPSLEALLPTHPWVVPPSRRTRIEKWTCGSRAEVHFFKGDAANDYVMGFNPNHISPADVYHLLANHGFRTDTGSPSPEPAPARDERPDPSPSPWGLGGAFPIVISLGEILREDSSE